MIETDEKVNQLEIEKTLNTSLPFLQRLRERGGVGPNRAGRERRRAGPAIDLDLDRFAA